jgi:hypothetical protein
MNVGSASRTGGRDRHGHRQLHGPRDRYRRIPEKRRHGTLRNAAVMANATPAAADILTQKARAPKLLYIYASNGYRRSFACPFGQGLETF